MFSYCNPVLKKLSNYDYVFFSFQVREKLSDLRCACCPDNTASGVWFASGGGLRFVQILSLISYLGFHVEKLKKKIQLGLDSPSPDFSRFRFVPAYALQSRLSLMST